MLLCNYVCACDKTTVWMYSHLICKWLARTINFSNNKSIPSNRTVTRIFVTAILESMTDFEHQRKGDLNMGVDWTHSFNPDM